MATKKNPPERPPPPLRLEWRSPAELAENPRNWRRHPEAQVAALSDAIAEVGWAGACLFNERTGRLIDGHARRKVALAQGCERVPVLVGDWSEDDERKILATLDPLSAMAERDGAALSALLADVSTGSEPLQALLDSLSGASVLDGDPVDDPSAEWQGMPEFQHEDGRAYRSLVVHFADEAAVRQFSEMIGQSFSRDAKFIYHPKHERPVHERYADES